MRILRRSLAFAILATGLLAIPTVALQAQTSDEISQVYPLAADGRVALRSVCGTVRIQSWDREEVLLEAVRLGESQQQLEDARIEVDSDPNSFEVRVEYPFDSFSCYGADRWGGHRNIAASVEFTLTVPRSAEIDKVSTVNCPVELSDLQGRVKVSTVNGDIAAFDLTGRVKLSSVNGKLQAQRLGGPLDLSTVNGRLEFEVSDMRENRRVSMSSVNGSVELRLPGDVSAQLRASTLHGKIRNDFGIPVDKKRYSGSRLEGRLGVGGPSIKLSNVNGDIRIREGSR